MITSQGFCFFREKVIGLKYDMMMRLRKYYVITIALRSAWLIVAIVICGYASFENVNMHILNYTVLNHN